MKIISKIFAGITLGMVMSVLLGTVMLQGILFKNGTELLGIGQVGLTYFVGFFIASLILMFLPGAREHKKIICAYPLAAVFVAATAWAGFFQMQDLGPSGDLLNVQLYIGQMVGGVAKLLFWVVPAFVTGAFAFLCWDAAQGPVAE